MRSYWDHKAHVNPAWYVDTSLDYDDPDMERFFSVADLIVAEAYTDARIRPAATANAVEIGSGLGRICRSLAKHFHHVVGVDISPQMVERARELVPDPAVQFRLGDGTTLGVVDDASADFVMSFTVFQHIPDRSIVEGYLAEAARVLRPGGVVAFQWNNLPHARLWTLRRQLLGVLQRAGLGRERYDRNAAEFLGCRISWPRVERALRAAGLEPVEHKGGGTLFAWAWARKPDAAA
jgi:SAM-dependent methyltransferase